MDKWKRGGGQIPAFGDWEHASELPITQYFESARQAGLIRNSSSGGYEQNLHANGSRSGGADGDGGGDMKATHLRKPSRELGHRPRKSRERKRVGCSHVKEEVKRRGKVIEPTRKHHQHHPMSAKTNDSNGVVHFLHHSKAVDEDLYKIPSHLLSSSTRKKMTGFFSCLVPSCAS